MMLHLRSCIPKINSTLIDSAEELDIVMYNLLEDSQGSLCEVYGII